MPIERKLAAIMFTDIAGYTEQMSKDESVAISLLNKKKSVLKPLIKEHNGTYVKSTGDGSLSHFNSAVDAATCAKRFQESIYDDKDLNVRVGVHLGDTIFEKKEILRLIKETDNIEYDLNYRIYYFLEDTSYLETAYNQVQELANNLEPDIAAKFLSYQIPAAIVEEWEKVK